jgi:hypothetical protein
MRTLTIAALALGLAGCEATMNAAESVHGARVKATDGADRVVVARTCLKSPTAVRRMVEGQSERLSEHMVDELTGLILEACEKRNQSLASAP